jgi:hypothetical protein
MSEKAPALSDRSTASGGNGSGESTDVRHLRLNEVFPLARGVAGIRVEIEWFSPHSGLADLDVYVLLYDENVRLMFCSVLLCYIMLSWW